MKLRNVSDYRLQLNGKCPYCQHASSFEQHGYCDRSVANLVALFVCAHCEGAVIAEMDTWSSEEPTSVLPRARPTFPSAEYEETVPANIAAVMKQVYAGVEVEAWMLVGMGVRLVVELMSAERCAAHGLKVEQGLKGRLRDLQAKYPALEGPIQLADTVRLLGNEVAHDHNFICGSQEAAVAVEMIEELLEVLYVLPARRKRLLERLPNRNDSIKKKSS